MEYQLVGRNTPAGVRYDVEADNFLVTWDKSYRDAIRFVKEHGNPNDLYVEYTGGKRRETMICRLVAQS